MAFLNTIVEFEGPVVDVEARYWAAHQAAIRAVGFQGPPQAEFWRLWRTGATDGQFVRFGRAQKIADYARIRAETIDSSDLMALDQAGPKVAENLRLLKQMGSCHLVSLSRNRDGLNATLDRLDLWIHFENKQCLPEDRDRRVEALRRLAGGHRVTLAVVGTVPMAYAAGEAGCRTVGLKSGPAVPKLLRQVGVDVFFESLDELTDALSSHHPDLQRIGVF
jgi:phosphoglycolate phosphatase-like HAD superfamily hydrolase